MIRMTEGSTPRQAAAPHGADGEGEALTEGVVRATAAEVHTPRENGIVSAGRRRPVPGPGKATFGHAASGKDPWPVIEGRIHRRVEGPGIDDTLQLLLIRDPPVV